MRNDHPAIRDLPNLAYDICRSLIHHGFNKIIVCLNHRGNAAMNHVARRFVTIPERSWLSFVAKEL
jgi:creatinine amidohydrolase/Fe(II)-dependent formamide hydrolase-like protein